MQIVTEFAAPQLNQLAELMGAAFFLGFLPGVISLIFFKRQRK